MADGVFNIAKGRVAQMVISSPAKFGVILLKASEADATLEDYDDIAALLVPAGNTRADFTNYADVTAETATQTPDDSNNWNDVDMPDQTWSSAGGAANNTLTKAIIFWDSNAGADADLIPLTHHDFAPTTDGSDLTMQVAALGFFRAT